MISYSTGSSGGGADVDKVCRDLLAIAQERRPTCSSTGRCSTTPPPWGSLGELEARGSKVAGHANVFIFPDLNTGNTTYKAVPRSPTWSASARCCKACASR